MARTYKRDSRGRFASGGGSSGGGRPKSKAMERGANRLTRDNAGRITSVGGAGATARGGRLATATGNKRATVTTRISGGRSGVVGKPKGLKPGAMKAKAAVNPASKVAFDEAAWRRRASRAKNAGLVRAGKEGDNPNIAKADKKVFKAYATRHKAEQFYLNLTKDKTDKTGRTLVRGAEGLKRNFDARPRRGTASTSIGVAALNRQYDAARRAKREASKKRK